MSLLPVLVLLATPAAEQWNAAGIAQEIDQARQALEVRDRRGALTHVEGAMALAAEVGRATIRERLESVCEALRNSDLSRADAALKELQHGRVPQEAEAAGLPLLQARENLAQARSRLLDGKPQEAAAPLRAVAQALDEYQRSHQGPRARFAREMAREIEEYAPRVKMDRQSALARISLWSDTVDTWRQEMTH